MYKLDANLKTHKSLSRLESYRRKPANIITGIGIIIYSIRVLLSCLPIKQVKFQHKKQLYCLQIHWANPWASKPLAAIQTHCPEGWHMCNTFLRLNTVEIDLWVSKATCQMKTEESWSCYIWNKRFNFVQTAVGVFRLWWQLNALLDQKGFDYENLNAK